MSAKKSESQLSAKIQLSAAQTNRPYEAGCLLSFYEQDKPHVEVFCFP
jgi:hypothetical protein